jgi:hypothetical protein
MYLAVDYHNRPSQVHFSSAEDLRSQLAGLHPHSELIDVTLHTYATATIAIAIVRTQDPPDLIYYSTVHVLFANRFWVLRLEVVDDEHHTSRETAVLSAMLASSDDLDSFAESPGLFSRFYDGMVPLERDPVARIRRLTDRLVRSLEIPVAVLDQPRYPRRSLQTP